NLVAGWQLGRSLLVALTPEAQEQDAAFMQAKVATARFYAEHILTKAPGLRDSIVDGAESVSALAIDSY
ncbi:MAG: acyl-CoA dehydrogenase C-terminal domain-containing protein, partial [Gammaproteobacteria bacterium]